MENSIGMLTEADVAHTHGKNFMTNGNSMMPADLCSIVCFCIQFVVFCCFFGVVLDDIY